MKKLILASILAVGGLYYFTLDSPKQKEEQIVKNDNSVDSKETSRVKIVNLDKKHNSLVSNSVKKEFQKVILEKKRIQNSQKLQTLQDDPYFVNYMKEQQRMRSKALHDQRFQTMIRKMQASKQKQQELRKKQQQLIATRMQQQNRLKQMRMEQQNMRYQKIYQQNMQRNIANSKQLSQNG